MEQKNNFRLFLLIGSSILLFAACAEPTTDWGGKYEFIYVNQTEHTLQFKMQSSDRIIYPQSSDTIVVSWFGPEKIEPELSDYNVYAKSPLCIGDTCVEVEQKGFVQGDNYQYEVLGDRHIRYTYTFTSAEIDELLQ